MGRFSFWQRWLFVVSLIISVFGILMAVFSGTELFNLFNSRIDPAFWGDISIGENAKKFQQWIYGVLGATLTGWGICLAFLSHYPFRNKEKWSWNCLLWGLLAWYLIDTSISIYFTVYFNACFNSVLFLVMIIPLLVTRKYFHNYNTEKTGV